MQVEQDRYADEPQRERRDDEEVGQRVDLDEREAVAPMEPDAPPSPTTRNETYSRR